jgi:dTDP-4-dehydrorhamnose reductase
MDSSHELTPLSGEVFLITGADGMLGRAFVEALQPLRPHVTVYAPSRQDLDITDASAVMAYEAKEPTVIVQCAGLSIADYCERHPEQARLVHVDGTHHIGQLAQACDARVLYPQSVFVYEGQDLPYTEQTPTVPLSIYSKVKLEAERYLLDTISGAISIRMAGFFGGEEKDKNFVGKFVREVDTLLRRGGGEVHVGDRVWQPTYTLDHARNSLLLLARRQAGVYNMGALGEASFYDVARTCVDLLGVSDRITVSPCPSKVFDDAEAVKRPSRMVTANQRLLAEGLCRQRPWEEALREYLSRPYFDSVRSRAPLRADVRAKHPDGAPT